MVGVDRERTAAFAACALVGAIVRGCVWGRVVGVGCSVFVVFFGWLVVFVVCDLCVQCCGGCL